MSSDMVIEISATLFAMCGPAILYLIMRHIQELEERLFLYELLEECRDEFGQWEDYGCWYKCSKCGGICNEQLEKCPNCGYSMIRRKEGGLG